MKPDRLNNGRGSGAASQTAGQSVPQSGEGGFLADQAADSWAATIHTLRELKGTLTRVADVRSCAKQHPWLIVAAATAAGFATGAVLTPLLRKKSEDKQSGSAPESDRAGEGQEAPQIKKAFLFSTLATFLASILQTVVRGWIAAALAGREQPRNEASPPQESAAPDALESRND